MSELNAESILAALDEDQQLAAKALRGPVAIVAGPGSGKTRTVSHRIAYGIATGVYNPAKTLAVSYTNRAAAELRLRLRQLGARSVQVRTFHSAALSQLQYFWPQVTGYSAPRLLTSKRQLVAEAAAAIQLPLSDSALLEAISEIEFLSYSMQSVESYTSRLSPERFPDLVTKYSALKSERKLIDWEDALLLCTGLLRNEPRIMTQFEQQYRHFTVDEYQDISPLQQGLLETWLQQREDICVVGDPRQTIYSFAGATSEFLLGFASRFEGAEIYELNRNYRSGTDIVALANAVLPDSPLRAVKGSTGAVTIQQSATAADEVTEVLAEVTSSASPLSEIAILARTNAQLRAFELGLGELGVPYQVRGQGRFFAKSEIRQAMMSIRALAVSEGSNSVEQLLAEILRPLGWSLASEPSELSRDLNWFFDVFNDLGEPSLEEYLRELDERERSGHEPVADAVTIATVHGTKGLEWNEVFLVGVNDKVFPISYAKSDAELAEERRLFYVAITRAKQKLVISSLANKPASPFISELSGNHNR